MEDMHEQRHLEGLRQAKLRREALTPEMRAIAEGAEAQLFNRLFRAFVGTEDMAKSKGHMPVMLVTAVEMREFRMSEPATHRWAAFEEKFLDLGDL